MRSRLRANGAVLVALVLTMSAGLSGIVAPGQTEHVRTATVPKCCCYPAKCVMDCATKPASNMSCTIGGCNSPLQLSGQQEAPEAVIPASYARAAKHDPRTEQRAPSLTSISLAEPDSPDPPPRV